MNLCTRLSSFLLQYTIVTPHAARLAESAAAVVGCASTTAAACSGLSAVAASSTVHTAVPCLLCSTAASPAGCLSCCCRCHLSCRRLCCCSIPGLGIVPAAVCATAAGAAVRASCAAGWALALVWCATVAIAAARPDCQACCIMRCSFGWVRKHCVRCCYQHKHCFCC